MDKAILFELEANRKKLNFYSQKLGTAGKVSPVAKWVEIYSERVKKLEKKATKLGLRTDLAQKSSVSAKLN